MKTLNINTANPDLSNLVDETTKSHEPIPHESIQILGKNANAILLSEKDWLAIQETLYLMSIPNMRDTKLRPLYKLH